MSRFTAALLAGFSLGMAGLSPFALGQAATVPAYTFVDLGTVNNLYTTATGINESGQITGLSHDGTNNRAYRITPLVSGTGLVWFQGSGNINSLITLVPTDSRHSYSESWGINVRGELAGQALGSGYVLPQNGFFWRADLSGVQLPSTQSWSYDINDNSSIVGEILNAKTASAGTIWRLVNGSFVSSTLPLPTGYTDGYARGLNNQGEVVGRVASTSTGLEQAYLWLPGTAYGLPAGTNLLPNLPVNNGSFAFKVNNTGSIAGWSHRVNGGGDEAVLWAPAPVPGTGFTAASLTRSDWHSSWAYGLNNPGAGHPLRVVGQAGYNGSGNSAFVWDALNGSRDLNLLTVNAPPGGMTEARGVNIGGLIVGNYTLVRPPVGASPYRAFLLVPNAMLPAADQAPLTALSIVSIAGVSSPNQIQITWTAGSPNWNGYQISRSKNGVGFTQIGWLSAGDLSVPSFTSFTDLFEDQPYTPATNYFYRVSAFNVAGYSRSQIASFVTPGAPLAPTSVTPAASTAPLKITVKWKNNSNTQDYLEVERSDNGTTFAQPGVQVSGASTSYIGTAVVVSHTYYYRVRAHSTNGSYSEYSAVVNATTPRR